jgi:hypothetical protein
MAKHANTVHGSVEVSGKMVNIDLLVCKSLHELTSESACLDQALMHSSRRHDEASHTRRHRVLGHCTS